MSGLTEKKSLLQPIVMHYENEGGSVKIVAPDNNIMAISVETAIEACRAFKQQIAFKDQFDLLLVRLAEWIHTRADKLSDAYLTVRDSGLLFLVVLAGVHSDETVEANLTELDLQVANDNDFNLISLAVHAIPNSSAAT